MGHTASWLKRKILSLLVPATNADTPNSSKVLQVVQAKEVGWHTSRNESGMACKTCIYYHLGVELVVDEQVPPETRYDYDDRELIEMVRLPVYWGYCTKVQDSWGYLISGIRSDHMCGHYEEKLSYLQFEDDVIEEDDGRTPVVPKVILET